MINKYIFLQEYIRSPLSSEKRITNNFWGKDCSPIQDLEYVAMISFSNIQYLFNNIKKFL